jgi:integrase/recombinase XerC
MEWFNLMRDLDWDHNSFITKAMAVRKFFEFYNKQGFKVIDPWLIPIPKKKFKMQRVATKEEYLKLLDIIPNNNDPRHIRNRAIINLLWDTGARNGEICSINVDGLDLVEKTAVIQTEKSRGARPVREIFWTEETNNNIKKWLEKRNYLKNNKMMFKDGDALFISVCSGGVHNNTGKRFGNKGLGEMLRRYCHRAKIENMNAHSFRHHMGHQIVKKGGSNSDVSNILGHSSLQSSYVYTLMTNKELKKRYEIFVK